MTKKHSDITKIKNESKRGRHAAGAHADGQSGGSLPGRKRGQIVVLRVLFVVLLLLALSGVVYLAWQTFLMDKAADEGSAPAPDMTTEQESLAENPIDFSSLRLENPDIYAWIYIPGTKVNYPVLQHPTDDSYYLKHDKDKGSSVAGAIYSQLANKTDFSDSVTVLYGHNMKSGGMFATLHYFENESFFDSHQDMFIYTDGHILKYQVIAAYQYDNRHILNSFNFDDSAVVKKYFKCVLNPDSLVVNERKGAKLSKDDKIVQLSTCTGDANRLARRYLVTGVLMDDQRTR